jgi:alcohol dehydrogenase class IV
MQPDVALLSGELVEKLPPSLIADGGFDVLSHALESLAATNATVLTESLATGAFLTVFHQLPDSMRGDLRAREQIHLASTVAGLAFTQSGLGLCHALSHALGGVFHLPHGRLNSILLPEVVACNTAAAERYAKLAKQAGLGANSQVMGVRNLRNALIRLRKEVHLPGSLQEAGIPPHKLQQQKAGIVAAALADPCLSTNPGKTDRALVERVLDQVSGRG